ncbi:MAG: dihydroneopterin triphosphate diphosphatase [Lautropia sp.]|nr:dihydroneopterin triphosphate diphosphatase [Lautropia sp.]
MKPNKIPVSVLVVIHTPDGQVLLLERADRPGFWQSVTGSLDAPDEDTRLAAARELQEETGLSPVDGELFSTGIQNRYEIYAHWRHRYGPGVTHNTEHVFHFVMLAPRPVRLAPREHLGFAWLPWDQAAARCFSPSNAEAIQVLAARHGWLTSDGKAVLVCAPASASGSASALPREAS